MHKNDYLLLSTTDNLGKTFGKVQWLIVFMLFVIIGSIIIFSFLWTFGMNKNNPQFIKQYLSDSFVQKTNEKSQQIVQYCNMFVLAGLFFSLILSYFVYRITNNSRIASVVLGFIVILNLLYIVYDQAFILLLSGNRKTITNNK